MKVNWSLTSTSVAVLAVTVLWLGPVYAQSPPPNGGALPGWIVDKIKSEPAKDIFSVLAPTTSLPKTQPVLKVHQLIFHPGAKLVLNQAIDGNPRPTAIVIVTRKLVLQDASRQVVILRETMQGEGHKAAAGRDGADGLAFQSQGKCDGAEGRHGGDGGNGTRGATGEPPSFLVRFLSFGRERVWRTYFPLPPQPPDIYLIVENLDEASLPSPTFRSLRVTNPGYTGTDGGTGGRGGNGGSGEQGSASHEGWGPFCGKGPGDGGDGGDGGSGGEGGRGGRGGRGGEIHLAGVKGGEFLKRISYYVLESVGGSPGRGGASGAAGSGARYGDGGCLRGTCTGQPHGRKGLDGKAGSPGQDSTEPGELGRQTYRELSATWFDEVFGARSD